MAVILFLLSLTAGLVAFGATVFAMAGIQQTGAAALWIIAAVLLAGAAITGAINDGVAKILKRLPPLP